MKPLRQFKIFLKKILQSQKASRREKVYKETKKDSIFMC